MDIPFVKYQGTGNDFVMIDQTNHTYLSRTDTAQVRKMCDRRFGIGADGLILLGKAPDGRLEMIYFNSDGSESTMCGNGGRCFAAFVHALGLLDSTHLEFVAIDGAHQAIITPKDTNTTYVELEMIHVPYVKKVGHQAYELFTGSPHFVKFTEQPVETIDVVKKGRDIRNRAAYAPKGINVNFVEVHTDGLIMRTYERGVEDETLSCGTGVTAAVLAYHHTSIRTPGAFKQKVKVMGGNLEVRFRYDPHLGYREVWLCGLAQRVFSGVYTV